MPVELLIGRALNVGPRALLRRSVAESSMTGIHFWGCSCCGTYDRQNEVVQVAFAFCKYEPKKFSGSQPMAQPLAARDPTTQRNVLNVNEERNENVHNNNK